MQGSKGVGRAPGNSRKKATKFLAKQGYLPYVGPVSVWIILFVFAPLGVILYFSFLKAAPLGGITSVFTLDNFRALAEGRCVEVFLHSFFFAAIATIACLLIGYPLAHFIVTCGGKWKTPLLFCVIIPCWTCYLIRIYALRSLLGTLGFMNIFLLHFGLISSPLGILYTPSTVVAGLIYMWLPFMILPIYSSLEGLDASVLEAATDLGATPLRRFFTVTLPLTRGGIFAGIILVFVPSMGAWLVPHYLGGAKVFMVGSLIEHYFITVANIPRGSAMAVILAGLVILIIYSGIKFGGEEALERTV